jgi:hypothetical protein
MSQPDRTRLDGMTDATGLPALVLHAARDIGSVGSALDAEMLLSTLLGSIYAGVEPDRGDALVSFTDVFRDHLDGSADPNAPLVRAVLDALTGQPVTAVESGPGWASALGTATVTGTYAYGDRYGDQTSYVATFAYAEPDLGGSEHAIVVLADHNLGLAKDIFLAAPAAGLLATLRDEVVTGDDEMTWFGEIAPATLRSAALAYLACTDAAPDGPESGSFADNRAIALARLGLLPPDEAPGPTAPVEDLVAAFLESPEADLAGLADLSGARRESCSYCLGLIVDFATSRGDALRWSPAGVETFLGSWVHERAILDPEDAELLPDALRAWIAWAGRRLNLPATALQATLATVRAARIEFLRLHETGERQSPATRAMARMMADGVDLTDMSAVTEWLKTYNDES